MSFNVEWIKVEDRLPNKNDINKDEFVWCYPTSDGDVDVAHYKNLGKSHPHIKKWAVMEFPEPPVEKCYCQHTHCIWYYRGQNIEEWGCSLGDENKRRKYCPR